MLDASAVGSFLLPGEDAELGPFAREICPTERLHVPPVWRSELASLLMKAFRRGRIDAHELSAAAVDADRVAAVVRVEAEPNISEILDGCARAQLKAYDYTYFAVARQLGMPLLTGDDQLRRAARAAGVALLLP